MQFISYVSKIIWGVLLDRIYKSPLDTASEEGLRNSQLSELVYWDLCKGGINKQTHRYRRCLESVSF